MKNLIFLLFASAALLCTTSCKKAAGDAAEVAEAAKVAVSTGKTFPVNVGSSMVTWEGAKPTGTHTGTISLTSGEVTVDGNMITGGSFVLDMNSITNTDLEGDMKAGLESHLKGTAEGKEDHFFNVVKYPTGTFDITKVTKVDGDEEATHLIYGNLTLKGITKEIGFKALVGIGSNKVEVTTPSFTIDRTQWGVNYNSKTVFEGLGDKFVNDEVGLTIKLSAGKEMM